MFPRHARSVKSPPSILLVIAIAAAMTFVVAATPSASRAAVAHQAAETQTAGTTSASRSERPNILLIMTDDQRLDTLDVMPQTTTWLGDGGVTYSRAVVTTPLCCPSRSSIFSGQYAHNHGVLDNSDPNRLNQQNTIQRYLKMSGYKTAIAGKYLNQWDLCNDDPPFFDRFAIRVNGPIVNARYRTWRNTGQNVGCANGGDKHTTTVDYDTTFVRDTALDYLEEFDSSDQAPWFLYVAPYAPHGPATPEAKYADAPVPAWERSPAVGEAAHSDKPPHVRDTTRSVGRGTPAARGRFRENQLRSLMSVDDMVGSLRAALEELGEDENTLVIFSSDNGQLWAEHGLADKREPYEVSVRVPFMVRWPRCESAAAGCPGTVPQGTHDDRLVANIDLAPTILSAAGITPKYVVDGQSLWSGAERDHILIEYYRDHAATNQFRFGPPNWAGFISPGDFIYRENYYDPDQGTSGCWDDLPDTACEHYIDQDTHDEYYDLRSDPYELLNQLGDADPATPTADVQTLSQQLAAARSCAGSTCP